MAWEYTRLFFSGAGGEGRDTIDNVNRMVALVAQKSLPKEDMLREYKPDAGHNEAAWRVRFPHAVEWLFGVRK